MPSLSLACAGCGGRLRFLATIDDAPVVIKILAHLGLPTGPALLPARTAATQPVRRRLMPLRR